MPFYRWNASHLKVWLEMLPAVKRNLLAYSNSPSVVIPTTVLVWPQVLTPSPSRGVAGSFTLPFRLQMLINCYKIKIVYKNRYNMLLPLRWKFSVTSLNYFFLWFFHPMLKRYKWFCILYFFKFLQCTVTEIFAESVYSFSLISSSTW
jgi:hypothetical protein